ncbi:MAG TPA: ABC transporter ATP-binding protein [Verrucomicrobiae bacterium]|nr:ABC transporter ATP-binding protein [Verrucomicrobiae bacterium]
MIELQNLSKRFGQRWAVAELTLRVPRGEIYGLLGHNGAGKSTAIGMMLGQVWPTAGQARICGYDITAHRPHALQKVGAIFESPAFYDYLSGWRNLEILCGYTCPAAPARLREVIAWVGLNGREHSKVCTYSHGMRARLALAQALLPAPELLILDEPSDGLDPEGIHEMRQTILRLQRELGLTILLSSHLLTEVEQLCTRIAVLNQGRKVFEGTLAETRRRGAWVHLKVGDSELASRQLSEAGLISCWRAAQPRNGSAAPRSDCALISLAEGVETDQVVKVLVERGIAVFEIAPQEDTLEDFYLSLMTEQRGPGTAPELSPLSPPVAPGACSG